MLRKIIKIDSEKCNGCGLCVSACHESAIGMVNGKARLLREDYCDGLGDCLPACPAEAISFEVREASAYDKEAVLTNQSGSRLTQWPVQIKLLPPSAPCYANADLLIAADCTAFSYGNFHRDFIRDKVVLVGCPKLDAVDYTEKLTEIFRQNSIRSVTVARMEVPCCGGIQRAVQSAIAASQKKIPCKVCTISTKGLLIRQEEQ